MCMAMTSCLHGLWNSTPVLDPFMVVLDTYSPAGPSLQPLRRHSEVYLGGLELAGVLPLLPSNSYNFQYIDK